MNVRVFHSDLTFKDVTTIACVQGEFFKNYLCHIPNEMSICDGSIEIKWIIINCEFFFSTKIQFLDRLSISKICPNHYDQI